MVLQREFSITNTPEGSGVGASAAEVVHMDTQVAAGICGVGSMKLRLILVTMFCF